MEDLPVCSVQVRPRRPLANITNDALARNGKRVGKSQKSSSAREMNVNPLCDLDDIYENMRANESRHYACEDYIYTQKQIAVTHKMRTILMSWIVEVADEYDLCCQTLHLAVYLVDTFLTRRQHVARSELQLIGVTCVLIAAKYEEMHPPSADDCSYITDYSYTSKQILDMEKTILVTIQFRISVVTCLDFKRFFQCDHPLVNYLLELALQHPIFLCYKPSQLAAAACAYTRALLGEKVWPVAMKAKLRLSFEEILPVIVQIQDLHRQNFGKPSKRHREMPQIAPLKRIPSCI